jgi:hypothetical protein
VQVNKYFATSTMKFRDVNPQKYVLVVATTSLGQLDDINRKYLMNYLSYEDGNCIIQAQGAGNALSVSLNIVFNNMFHVEQAFATTTKYNDKQKTGRY